MGLEQQLKDALAEEIRALARSLKHTAVFACRKAPRAFSATQVPPPATAPPGADLEAEGVAARFGSKAYPRMESGVAPGVNPMASHARARAREGGAPQIRTRRRRRRPGRPCRP